ncbi:hypothetical protein ACPA9J_03735 [Pseudomonas aeruginosa]
MTYGVYDGAGNSIYATPGLDLVLNLPVAKSWSTASPL